mgnify:CR=1 FL=1
MVNEVRLNKLRPVIEALEYPIGKEAAREKLADVRLLYADGEEPLKDVLARANTDTFDDPDDIEAEIYNNLPIEAVGEPGQSEGDA